MRLVFFESLKDIKAMVDSSKTFFEQRLSKGRYVCKRGTCISRGGGGWLSMDSWLSVFSFSKLLDAISKQLAQACAAGTHISKIVVAQCRAGKERFRSCNTPSGNA